MMIYDLGQHQIMGSGESVGMFHGYRVIFGIFGNFLPNFWCQANLLRPIYCKPLGPAGKIFKEVL
jgi:hypothetical protein